MVRTKSATLPAVFLAAVVRVAEQRGVSSSVVLAGAGVSASVLETPQEPISLEAVFGGWAAAMRALRDDGLPVQVARTFSIEHYSVLGFAVMTAATGREALARVVRFAELITNHGGRWQMQETAQALHVRWLRAGERTLGHRAANESVLAEFLHVARQVLSADLNALSVSFEHAAPPDPRAHTEHFGVSPRWQAEADELVLPKTILSAVPSFANPALSRHFEDLAQRLLQASSEPSLAENTARARRAISEALPNGEPASGAIAKVLGMSERSLRRALANEGASFSALVEAVRKERASVLLSDRRASLAEVAFSLGFSELSAFSRAYKRWHGRAPSEVRREAQLSAAR
ncbi:MAG TPA: AraC family transcriptional regulator ligand-binding domain-containing protein [Polyangiaceae bacterium]|nr:AraC family transcriptional regulator ligand-binding domain-containing protein [Polyangiaceae bacterium]